MFTRLLPLLLVVATTGCFSKSISSPMRESAAPSTSAPSDKARVLVVRPGRMKGKMITHHVVDGAGAFLGDTFNDTVFVADVAPGRHDFCVANFGDGGPSVQANLAAGKTYVLRVDIAMGYPYLTPMKPGDGELKELMGDLPGIRGAEFLGSTAEDAPNQEEVRTLFGRCSARNADTSPEDKAKLVLKETDAI